MSWYILTITLHSKLTEIAGRHFDYILDTKKKEKKKELGVDSLYILPIQYNCCWLADGALCLVYQQHGVHLASKESSGFGHNLIKFYSLQTQFYAATDLKIGCQWTSTTDIFTFYWVVIIRGYQKSNHCMGFKAICLTNLPEMSALQLFNQGPFSISVSDLS